MTGNSNPRFNAGVFSVLLLLLWTLLSLPASFGPGQVLAAPQAEIPIIQPPMSPESSDSPSKIAAPAGITLESQAPLRLTEEDIATVLAIMEAVKDQVPTQNRDFYDILAEELLKHNLTMDAFLTMKDRVDRAIYSFLESFVETEKRDNIQQLVSLLKGLKSQLSQRLKMKESKEFLMESHISSSPVYQRWKAIGEEIAHLNRKLTMLNDRLKEVGESDKFLVIEEIAYNESKLDEYRDAMTLAESQKNQMLSSITEEELNTLQADNETTIEGMTNDIEELSRLLGEAEAAPEKWEEIRSSIHSGQISREEMALVEKYLDRLLVYIGKRNSP